MFTCSGDCTSRNAVFNSTFTRTPLPMSSKRKYSVFVVVFRGEPMDFSKWRHTGLWLVPDDETHSYYFHVCGIPGSFQYEKRTNYDPEFSTKFAGKIPAGDTKLSLSSSELATLLESVAVRNDDPEFNCQQWVQKALLMLFQRGYLDEAQYNAGLDGMIETTMEASDETLA
ncbi:hypothetical protein CCM_06332 [Cordyceps militaris CM01]|uniref:Uncharacterized protein n=1 Tax=Cordyceps militaris (strain CM01) TaxID=983644 RepID=G3JK41_CORMM|nr:uncharacterized protein CCM_06332 [Cordyceps militaris CM01]EGX92171.1 hypothetical protein CCM_06332 [Cordyceps militaris CM01]